MVFEKAFLATKHSSRELPRFADLAKEAFDEWFSGSEYKADAYYKANNDPDVLEELLKSPAGKKFLLINGFWRLKNKYLGVD